MSLNFNTQIPVTKPLFTETDLYRLTMELADYPDKYPQLAALVDRVQYELGHIMLACCNEAGCHCTEGFDEFHAKCQTARTARLPETNPLVSEIKSSDVYFSLKSLAISEYLRRAALSFPPVAEHCDRLIYELLIACAGGVNVWEKDFETFQKDCRLMRQMTSPVGAG